MAKRLVHFFESYGEENTDDVINTVVERLRNGDIKSVVVASCTGKTAIRVTEKLRKSKMKVDVVSVAGPQEYWKRVYPENPLLGDRERKILQKLGVRIIDNIMEPLQRPLNFRNWWAKKTIKLDGEKADLFWMTLICVGGHGFRTAIESVFMAVQAQTIKEGEEVLSIAGTETGADSAIVMKATKFENVVGPDPDKRMKIEEILAMPKRTTWIGYG